MKNIVIIFFGVFCLFSAKGLYAQNCESATFRTEPASFTAEDEVTLFVDVSGCPTLAALDEVYLWIFVPDGPGPDGVGGNGDFCNGSNPELAMTNEGDNIWSFTFVPTELFASSPATIGTQIGFIPKARAACQGNGDQTVDLFIPVEPLIFIPSEERIFPSKFTNGDIVTLFFDQSLAENAGMADLEEIYVYTWINRVDAAGAPLDDITKAGWGDVATTPELKMKDEGNGLFSLTLIPEEFYPIEEGDVITKINYIFRNAEGSVQSANYEATPVTAD